MQLEAGAVIAGRYRLASLIGEGGMASVWRAEDDTLERSVAIKVLFPRPQRDSRNATEQFLREARIAASVQHRNVIHTLDFGVTEEHMPFMVMELLHGESLAERMSRRPPLRIDELVQIVSLTLRGLSAVHDAGIVHRDLKPDNVFLQHDSDSVFPKILDFGISRSLGGSSRSAIATQEGLIVGTPEYMAPEQARGESEIDKRADIYAIGAIMYEGLTGRVPFEASKISELLVKIAAGRPTPLRERRPDLPEALAQCVEQAMARDRDARYPDAAAFRRALTAAAERALAISPTAFTSESPIEHAAFEEVPLTLSAASDLDVAQPVAAAAAGIAQPAGAVWGGFAELEARAPRPARPARESAASSSAVVPQSRVSSATHAAVRAAPARIAAPDAHTEPVGVSHDDALFGDNPLDTFAGDAGRLELDVAGPRLPRVMGVSGVAANQTSRQTTPTARAEESRAGVPIAKPSAAFWVLPVLLIAGFLVLLFAPSVFSPPLSGIDAAPSREARNPATRDGQPFGEPAPRPKLGSVAPALRDITF